MRNIYFAWTMESFACVIHIPMERQLPFDLSFTFLRQIATTVYLNLGKTMISVTVL